MCGRVRSDPIKEFGDLGTALQPQWLSDVENRRVCVRAERVSEDDSSCGLSARW